MSKERILDIGIGSGGAYVTKNTAQDEQRVGIDVEREALAGLRITYPDILPVLASAEALPFKENTFSRLEIVLPFGYLMIPGLQKDHFALNDEYRMLYAKIQPDGWYSEFQRVLQPQGKLVIFGDIWVDPEKVRETSKKFFSLEHVHKMTVAEFRSLGTQTVPTVLENIRNNPYIDPIGKKTADLLTKISLQSTKCS
jgi:ubiquinone/menaquinone biosynthesis C-methylase UbiE